MGKLCPFFTVGDKALWRRGEKMKRLGVVRPLDRLGRIVLPIELRRSLGIELKDALEISVQGDQIMLRKYQRSCVFCQDAHGLEEFKGKLVCRSCRKGLRIAVTGSK